MTQPTAHGYPDWNRVASQADVRYAGINRLTAVTFTEGPFFVGNLPAVGLYLEATTNPWRVEIEFHNESALNFILGRYTVELATTGVTFNQVVPVLGPWMAVRFVTPGAGGEYVLRAWGTALPALPGLAADPILFSIVNQNVNAGATFTGDATRVWPGEACWYVQSGLATWFATLQGRDTTGAVTRLNLYTQASLVMPQTVFLPALTPRLTFTNSTGAAGTFSASLVARPMAPGW